MAGEQLEKALRPYRMQYAAAKLGAQRTKLLNCPIRSVGPMFHPPWGRIGRRCRWCCIIVMWRTA